MTKIKSLFEKHFYLLFFFSFILIYSIVVPGALKPWSTIDLTQSFHAVDYSMGFCARFLPGAVYQSLFGAVNESTLNIYMSLLMVVFFFVLSLFLERFVLAVGSEYRFIAIVLMLFFVTGPATFSFYIKVLGMLDVYWVFAALLFFVLLSDKKTWFFLFLPFLACVLTYFVTWLCYIPLFIIIALYKISDLKAKKEKAYLWISLSVSIAVAALLTVYLVFFERENLTYTLEGFIDALSSNGSESHLYYIETLYYYGYETPADANIFDELLVRLSINFTSFNSLSKISLTALLLPLIVFIYKFFLKQLSLCGNKLKKLSYICVLLLFPGTFVFSFFTSTDLIRWTGHSFLPLFISFLYILHNEGSEAWKYVKESFEKVNFRIILIYLLFYMSVVYDPYYV